MNVQSYGGGLNSAGLALLCYEREVVVDLRLFSDVGAEWPETYEHIEIMDRWLQQHTGVGITRVREERFTLEDECLSKHSLPSIVMGFRSCSDKFKIRPQNRYMRSLLEAQAIWARGEKITKLVGFDADESHRVKDYDDTRYKVRYPLVEAGWTRRDCEEACVRHGVPVPRKSSCFYCPEMQWDEIADLQKTHPDLLQRALEMEKNATALHSVKGLSRTMSWADALVYISTGEIDRLPKRMRRMPCTCAG